MSSVKSKLNYDKSNKEFYQAIELVEYTNQFIYLTGKAGTGKTTFLKYLKDFTKKNYVVLAPTGVAAINAGGVTINSFLQIPFGPFILDDERLSTKNNKINIYNSFNYSSSKLKLIEELDLIIIDEISMVRCDTLDVIDKLLRVFRKKMNSPFGGIQLVLIGDSFQLPPIANKNQWEILSIFYESPYFFNSNVFKKNNPIYIELKKIYRQKDEIFIRLLNNIRNNNTSEQDLIKLNSKFDPDFNDENYITLATHNKIVDEINSINLLQKNVKIHQYIAKIEGEFSKSSLPTDEVLKLRKGAQIMFVKNDSESKKRFFNGKIGVIKSLKKDEITIECENNEEIKIVRDTWFNLNYTFNRKSNKIETEVIGMFVQFPIRLAWAITVHKSQGLTFEKMIVDLRDAFAPGQIYVALSRCTSLNGLKLRSKIPKKAIKTSYDVIEFAENTSSDAIINNKIINGKSDYYYNQANVEFIKNNSKTSLKLIKKALKYKQTNLSKLLYNKLIKINGGENAEIIIKNGNMGKNKYIANLINAKQVVDLNYELLEQHFNLKTDKKTFKSILANQRKTTNNLFDDLIENLSGLEAKSKINKLTKKWWLQLSKEWQELILFNLDFMPKYEINKKRDYSCFSGFENNYKSLFGEKYIPKEKVNVKNILNEVKKLKTFIIDEIEGDLEPISKLNFIENLEIYPREDGFNLSVGPFTNVKYDISPLTKLINLKSLYISNNCNIIDTNPIYKLTNLENLNTKLYLDENIQNLTKLTSISCETNTLKNIRKLKKLKRLSTGSWGCEIDFELICESFKDLEDLSFMVFLIRNKKFASLLNLKNLKKLRIDKRSYEMNKNNFINTDLLEVLQELEERGVEIT